MNDNEYKDAMNAIKGISRICQHTDKDFSRFFFLGCEEELLGPIEMNLIKIFNPKYNKTHCTPYEEKCPMDIFEKMISVSNIYRPQQGWSASRKRYK
jgi:hypothetical protein